MLKVSASEVVRLPPGEVRELLCDTSSAFARVVRDSVARDNRRSLENLPELAAR